MNKRNGRWRGEVDKYSGLKALGTIDSAPATLMMSRVPTTTLPQDEYTVAAAIRLPLNRLLASARPPPDRVT
jgi:hypothetical protein